LYPWAFARKHKGVFVLRIEDTDADRSTPEAVQAILDSMRWLGLDFDEGPFYQMQRMDRYRQVLEHMLASGTAYRCYMSATELDQLREQQIARGEKPRYDRRWRPEPGKTLPREPEGVAPAIRFANPLSGVVAWDDGVKGRIEISNDELDDLVIARSDGTPTYNFCVVVDDLDMAITHVIRGDDHVNNTPRQINILRALEGKAPVYAHLPTVLTPDGEKLSKRHGAKGVLQYEEEGYLADAVVNYLARLGWSHGDDEIFSREQFIAWFDLDGLTPSPGRFDPGKLLWLNHEYIKHTGREVLGTLLTEALRRLGVPVEGGPDPAAVAELYRDRAPTLQQMAQMTRYFYCEVQPTEELLDQHVTAAILPALEQLAESLRNETWRRETIGAAIKATASDFNLKLPQIMMPLRVLVAGAASTPSVDAVLSVLGRDRALERLDASLQM
jgi:glutamyl-tRNA synthetase